MMRPHLVLALGLSACAHGAVFRAPPHEGSLTEEERALILRMSTDAPTPDAMSARRRAGDIRGELGSAELELLVNSSIRWIGHLERSGALSRLRAGCSETSKEVIGTLATEEGAARPDAPHDDLFDEWWSSHLSDPDCRASFDAMRAVAFTRGWLERRPETPTAALRAFRDVVERLRGPSPCPAEVDPVLEAAARHVYELDPLEVSAVRFEGDACVSVQSLGGVGTAPEPLGLRFWGVGDERTEEVWPGVAPVAVREVEAVTGGWHGGNLHRFVLARVDGSWRVVHVEYAGVVCFATYLRGEL